MKVSTATRRSTPIEAIGRVHTVHRTAPRLIERSTPVLGRRPQTPRWPLFAASDVETSKESEGFPGRKKPKSDQPEMEERVVELRRVSTTVKGGRQISFRAVVVVGDGRGKVGVGNASAKEIPAACRRAALKAKANSITVPLMRYSLTFPQRQEARFGAAKVMLRPAAYGTGKRSLDSIKVSSCLQG